MKNFTSTTSLLSGLFFTLFGCSSTDNLPNEELFLVPIIERVNIQTEIAKPEQIIDGQWVPIGPQSLNSIQYDYTTLYNNKPSYRFELNENDNTIPGYNEGTTKGRAEFSYCYATSTDFEGKAENTLANAQKILSVYHYGKGIIPPNSTSEHSFSVYFPKNMSTDVNTIFAQIHGMPDRTLVQNPDGDIYKMTDLEFLQLLETTIFKNNIGYERVIETDKNGNPKYDANGNIRYKAGEKNGWFVEQGGYPPLECGISKGYLYIKCHSDRKWLTNLDDRTNANVERTEVMVPVSSEYKTSTVAYKTPFSSFPRNCWVTFNLKITWSRYGGEIESVTQGKIDGEISYKKDKALIIDHIINNENIYIGRNDESGYYFKFGIYRTNSDTTPLTYNLANYVERITSTNFKSPQK